MDLATGAYLGIDAHYLSQLRLTIANWPKPYGVPRECGLATRVAFDELIANLYGRGVLTTAEPPEQGHSVAVADVATESVGFPSQVTKVRIPHIVWFLVAFLKVAAWHGDKKLEVLLQWLRRQQLSLQDRVPTKTNDDWFTLLTSFCRLRLWFYTTQRHCLFDSLVLAVLLTRRKVRCTFFIGVSTKPFSAHAWVQIGKVVLNDTYENVQLYTPILSIGDSA